MRNYFDRFAYVSLLHLYWCLTCGKVATNYELFFILLVLIICRWNLVRARLTTSIAITLTKYANKVTFFSQNKSEIGNIVRFSHLNIWSKCRLILFACIFFQLNQEIIKFFFWCADRHQEKMKQVQAHIVRFRDIINKESTKLSHKFWWILRFSSTLNWVSDSLERTWVHNYEFKGISWWQITS